jgi:hypothetical protein
VSAGGGERAGWAALAATVGAALLYGTGWVYATRWFENFGLGAVGLDIPKEVFFVWGAEAWGAHGPAMISVAVLAAAAVAAWRRWAQANLPALLTPYLPYVFWGFLLPVIAFSVFLGLYRVAVSVADEHAAAERTGGFADRPAVEIQFTAAPPPAGADKLNDRCHRLLLRAKDALIVVRPRRGEAEQTLQATVIPTSQIALWRATPVAGPCP